MKIVFLCGSIEPGRDGVGDYTRRLSGELIKQGWQVALLSLNEQNLAEEVEGDQVIEGISIQTLRIPSGWKQWKRFRRAKEWISMLNPEWLSLQFVTFSFHPKGFPITLGSWLKWVGQKRCWHIMFHELWVGMDVDSSKKFILLGWFQQKILRRLVKSLNPVVMHTQSRFYQAQLAKYGFPVGYLPLFGNIPVVDTDDDNSCTSHILTSLKVSMRLVLFGAIYPSSPIEEFAKEVADYSKKFKVNVILIIIGRSGSELQRWAIAWKSAGLVIEVLGEQTNEIISEVLSNASYGISTTPFVLAEKSSAIATMREHGLPVLCVSVAWRERHNLTIEPPLGIFEYEKGRLEQLLSNRQRLLYGIHITDVALQLANAFRYN